MAAIWYFSSVGETMINGQLKRLAVGNTETVARILHQITDFPLTALSPVEPYAKDYHKVLARAGYEQKSVVLPLIKPVSQASLGEDVWFIGYPNWFGTIPKVVETFLTTHDTKGKIILPFCTHEGSGWGSSVQDIQRLCPLAHVKVGLPVRGSRADKSQRAVENWLQQLKWPVQRTGFDG